MFYKSIKTPILVDSNKNWMCHLCGKVLNDNILLCKTTIYDMTNMQENLDHTLKAEKDAHDPDAFTCP